MVALAAAWWREHAGQPRFLWVHLYDPHSPYEPPEPFAARYAERPYLGEVAATDAVPGPLLAELERLRDLRPALVILLSDHGEGLGDHGEEEHGILLYRETLQVPLVLKLPAGAARRRERRGAGAAPRRRAHARAAARAPAGPERRGASLLELGRPAPPRGASSPRPSTPASTSAGASW